MHRSSHNGIFWSRTRRKMISEERNEASPVMPFRELLSVVGNAVKSVKSEAIKKSFKHTLFSLPQYGSRDKQEGSKRLNNLIEIAPAFEDLVEKHQCKCIFHWQLDFVLYWLSQLIILEFEGGKKRMQNSVKSGLFSASCASVGILIKQTRKLRSMWMNAQPVGFLKSGN